MLDPCFIQLMSNSHRVTQVGEISFFPKLSNRNLARTEQETSLFRSAYLKVFLLSLGA